MKLHYKLIILFLIVNQTINSQIRKPSLSPKIKTEQFVGLAKFNIEYGQPSKNEREIFGSLIPYNKLWRTGANASTKITINQEVYLANNKIPKGTYGLYTIPNKKEWTIILHKNANLWGAGGYKKENDFIRFNVPSEMTKDTRETLGIYFEKFNTNGADLIINWEKTKVKIPVFVDSDAIIFAEIDSKINKVAPEKISAQTYFDAAQFYYHKNTKLNTAFKWFNKATELKPGAFWYEYYKGELALKIKKYNVAKNSAKKCLKASKNSKSSDYGYIAKCSLLLKASEKK